DMKSPSHGELLTSSMKAVFEVCMYRYDEVDTTRMFIDGPLTLMAAVGALVGAKLAVKFLAQAGLNRDLTAAYRDGPDPVAKNVPFYIQQVSKMWQNASLTT
uniref:Saccharopine dehydrogenase n=1 Tax=Bursaphelenchus xylophilus TaxID=6326 RepID=A0A1I7SIY1_BURXY